MKKSRVMMAILAMMMLLTSVFALVPTAFAAESEYQWNIEVDDSDSAVRYIGKNGTVHTDHSGCNGNPTNIDLDGDLLQFFNGGHLINSTGHFIAGDITAEFTFTGIGFKYMTQYRGPAANGYGDKLDVYVDGAYHSTISGLNGNNDTGRFEYEVTGLENKTHKVELKSKDGLRIAIDGFAVSTFALSSTQIDGWVLGEGYDITDDDVHAGKSALIHKGNESEALSKEILFRDGVTYAVRAYVKRASAADLVTIGVDGLTAAATEVGKWQAISVNIEGDGSTKNVSIKSKGNVVIDDVEVCPLDGGVELLNNGSFTGSADGWNLSLLNWDGANIEGHTGSIKTAGSQVGVGTTAAIPVDIKSYYMYSADFYLEKDTGAPWIYVDMNDASGELQLRGTKSGEWHTVSGIWYSDYNNSVSLRIVAENNWDIPSAANGGGTSFNGAAWVDNISFKKVTVGEDLITDEGFEKNGWQLNNNASIQSGSYYLYDAKSLKLNGNASAVANGGEAIAVQPNTYYYMSCWTLRPGDKTVAAKISIKDANGATELASISGSRYYQTMWNPAEADPSNVAESKTAHWEQVGGYWYSGENTAIKVYAESTGNGAVYFDKVEVNSYENRAEGANAFNYGTFETERLDADAIDPTNSEKARVEDEYNSFLANNLANFPASFTIGDKAYKGFSVDFSFKSSSTENVRGGVETTSVLMHTSGLEFTVKSVLYKNYNAYDWTIYIANNTGANSPVVKNLNAVDMTFKGYDPELKGNYGDSQQYKPYTVALEGNEAFTATPTGGRGTQSDSSYFDLEYGEGGVMYAVGWPGQWRMTLDNTQNVQETRLTAGQQYLSTYIAPGETIRTPLMAFVYYDGRNQDRATNLWRHWMIDCNMHRIDEDNDGQTDDLPSPAIYAATSIQWHEMTRATDDNQIDAIKYYLDIDIKLTFWWMDAGWYYRLVNGELATLEDWAWTDTGVWLVDESRFPSKMKAISDFAANNGIKTLLWFEPERIANYGMLTTDGRTINPNWCLSGGAWPIMDMGNKQAVEWMTNRIIKVMEEGGISMYREDFNTDPLPNWTQADAAKGANRTGITENLYIQGHLGMWDDILEYFPNATIDACASGGKRNDLETMRRGIPLHKTDYDYGNRPWQQAIAAEMSRWIPFYGTKANGEKEADNLTVNSNRYSLRTALVLGMVLGYNTDSVNAPIDWDIVRDITEEHADITDIMYGDYYLLEDWNTAESKWMAWEYYDVDMGEGFVLAFRRETAGKTRSYKLKGLEPDTSYRVWFEDQNKPQTLTGKQLMETGVEFRLPANETSDILHIVKAENAPADRNLTADITKVSINGQHKGSVNTSVKSGYTRFDVRFNMALRDTILETGAGYIETGVQNDYKQTISIDGRTVGQLLATDANAVVMDYDTANNILNVYVKSSLIASNMQVVLSEELASDGGAKLAEEATFEYSSVTGWGDTVEVGTISWTQYDDNDDIFTYYGKNGTVHKDHSGCVGDPTNINVDGDTLQYFSGSHLINSSAHSIAGGLYAVARAKGVAFKIQTQYRGPIKDGYTDAIDVYVDNKFYATFTGFSGNNDTSLYEVMISGLENKEHEIKIISHDGYRTMIDAISVGTVKETYDLTINAGVGGSVSAKKATVFEGDNYKFTFTPEEGYELDKLLIGGVSHIAVSNTITVMNITKDTVVDITFKKKAIKVTAQASNADISIAPAAPVYGDNVIITVTPDEGYEVEALFVNGANVGAVTQYTVINAKADITVTANIVEEAVAVPVVQNVTATSQDAATIEISWVKIDEADGYKVYRAESINGVYSLMYTATVNTKTSVVNSGRITGKPYYYKVSAIAYGVEGEACEPVEGRAVPVAPETVKAVSQNYSTLKVSWTAVAGADGYRVYRSDSAAGEYTAIYTTTSASKLSVNNLNRVTGMPYYYKVCAIVNYDGEQVEGTLSSAKLGKAVPSKPKNVKTSSVSATTIKVSWDAVVGAKGYKLYASTTGKTGTFYVSYTTTNPNKLSVNVLNKTPGKTYYFKVRAISEYEGATVSGTLSAVATGKAVPAKPVVTISKASATSIRNKWNAVYKADGYEVYRSLTGNAGTFYLQKRTEYLSYANTALKKGQTYYYKVRAYTIENGKRVYGAFSAVKSYTL